MKRFLRIIAALLALSFLFCLAGCGEGGAAGQGNASGAAENTTPDVKPPSDEDIAKEDVIKVVSGALESFRAMDIAAAEGYFEAGAAAAADMYFGPLSEAYKDLLRVWTEQLSYEIKSAEVFLLDGIAVVKADVSYKDASNVLAAAGEEYTIRSISLSAEWKAPSDAQIIELFISCMNNAAQSVSPQDAFSAEIGFPLKKIDGEWKIANFTEEMLKVTFCGIAKTVQVFQ